MKIKPFIAILADLHFGVSNFSKPMFESQMLFFESQFFPYLIQNNIKHVICAGDFFHSREKISWVLLNELKRRFFQWFDDNNISLHMIVGNHDLQYRNTLEHDSLTETTKSFKNVIIYNEVTLQPIGKYTIGFVPWIIDEETFNFPKNCDIIIAHLELMGFPMMKGISAKSGIDHTTLKSYKFVFSGHFHTNCSKDNVHMVGTPYQLTWNDFDTPKGFYILDEKFGYEYVKNTINPKFVKLYYSNDIIEVEGLECSKNITKVESLEIAKENFCRLYIKEASDQLEVDTYHTSLQAVSKNNYKIEMINLCDVIEDFDAEEFNEKLNSDESTIDIIISCINGMTFEEGISKDVLVNGAISFYKQTMDEALEGEE